MQTAELVDGLRHDESRWGWRARAGPTSVEELQKETVRMRSTISRATYKLKEAYARMRVGGYCAP